MPQDLRMVVLALSPKAAGYVKAACELAIEQEMDEHLESTEAILSTVIAEIDEHIGKLPTAEAYAKWADAAGTHAIAEEQGESAAKLVADKMAKASRAAVDPDGDCDHTPPERAA